jgi:3-dehydroquinate dehydratase-2
VNHAETGHFEGYFSDLELNFRNRIHLFQSNLEGELIDKIQEFGFSYDRNP